MKGASSLSFPFRKASSRIHAEQTTIDPASGSEWLQRSVCLLLQKYHQQLQRVCHLKQNFSEFLAYHGRILGRKCEREFLQVAYLFPYHLNSNR